MKAIDHLHGIGLPANAICVQIGAITTDSSDCRMLGHLCVTSCGRAVREQVYDAVIRKSNQMVP